KLPQIIEIDCDEAAARGRDISQYAGSAVLYGETTLLRLELPNPKAVGFTDEPALCFHLRAAPVVAPHRHGFLRPIRPRAVDSNRALHPIMASSQPAEANEYSE